MKEESTEPQKKKRGRPKKYNPYNEFQPDVIDVFSSYFDSYRDIIEAFYNSTSRIEKAQWEMIYEHIKAICEKCSHENIKPCTYKPNSSWSGLDEIHEERRKSFVKGFAERQIENSTYKGYMIFSHLKYYIIESSKEMKV